MDFIFKKLKLRNSDIIDSEFDSDAEPINNEKLKEIIKKDNEGVIKTQVKPNIVLEAKPKPALTDIVARGKCKGGFKIIILGDVAVGKTSIFQSLVDKPPDYAGSTFQPDSSVINYNDMIILINDTVGQEAYRSIYQNYYREPQIVVFVFDINRIQTFMNIPEWQQEVYKRNDPSYPIKYYLVANKRDLEPIKSLDGAKQFAKDNDMTLIVTSIKQPETIELLRSNIFQYIDQNMDKGKLNVKETLKIGELPVINNCCNT